MAQGTESASVEGNRTPGSQRMPLKDNYGSSCKYSVAHDSCESVSLLFAHYEFAFENPSLSLSCFMVTYHGMCDTFVENRSKDTDTTDATGCETMYIWLRTFFICK